MRAEALETTRFIALENAELRVLIDTLQGGRVASLLSKVTGLEFLTQPDEKAGHVAAGMDARFEDGPCAGLDDCLPTVAPCEAKEGRVPDHGDLWQIAWTSTPVEADRLQLEATCFSRPLRVCKTLWLSGSELHMQYTVQNIGSQSTAFLYACHPLFAVSAGDRVLLPEEATELRLEYVRHLALGKKGDRVAWPSPESSVDLALDRVEAAESGTACMLYTDRLTQGACGLYRAVTRQRLTLSFDAAFLPYLGVWLCYGGWPDHGRNPQYAVALEPTTAPFGSLLEAEQAGAATRLEADEEISWNLTIRIDSPA